MVSHDILAKQREELHHVCCDTDEGEEELGQLFASYFPSRQDPSPDHQEVQQHLLDNNGPHVGIQRNGQLGEEGGWGGGLEMK